MRARVFEFSEAVSKAVKLLSNAAKLLRKLLQMPPVRDVLEMLSVLLLVHVQQVTGTAVSGTTLRLLELVRQLWKWKVSISRRPSATNALRHEKKCCFLHTNFEDLLRSTAGGCVKPKVFATSCKSS